MKKRWHLLLVKNIVNFSYPQTPYEIPNPAPKKETLMTLRVI
jgi:hypothetical protein